MYSDEDLVMISAIQHYIFCPRQCALIHVDGEWEENHLTAAGGVLHEKVDRGGAEKRRDVIQSTSQRVVSRRLGITGIMDMCEFHACAEDAAVENGARVAVELPHRQGCWKPFPVEYKHGKPKANRSDDAQLCAQAMCLEEMFGVSIPRGALFYGKTRQRHDVEFDAGLRDLTERVIEAIHAMDKSGELPPPAFSKSCAACSLVDRCRPAESGKSAKSYFARRVEEALK